MKGSKIWILVLVAIVAVIFLVPGLRNFFKDQVMMKPTVEKLNNEVTVTDAEYNIELKGMNVPNANLKDFKGKVVFLNFWEHGARHAVRNGQQFRSCTMVKRIKWILFLLPCRIKKKMLLNF